MTGLDNILNQIELEAMQRAQKVTDDARKTAEGMVSDAVKKANEIKESFEERAKLAVIETEKRAAAADEIETKRAFLKTKQELIAKALETAKAEIKGASTEEYFSFLESILKKSVQNGEGKVIISKADLSEMTESFEKALADASLKAEEGDIANRNGFVIVYGSIEINCTVDALFDEKAEELADSLNELFFGSEGGN